MTELQVTESSGDAAVDGAPVIIGDTLTMPTKDGRKLTLKYPGPLSQYKIVLAMGTEAADNTRFVRMCMPLVYLSAIDGVEVFLPTTLLQIDALIGRLGHKGLKALQEGVKIFDAEDEAGLDDSKK